LEISAQSRLDDRRSRGKIYDWELQGKWTLDGHFLSQQPVKAPGELDKPIGNGNNQFNCSWRNHIADSRNLLSRRIRSLNHAWRSVLLASFWGRRERENPVSNFIIWSPVLLAAELTSSFQLYYPSTPTVLR